MDLRVFKTRNLIINAFLQVRTQKTLEKITVKEIADLARINKSTFYAHFKDIYDLSDTLENELVQQMVKTIPHAENIIEMPYEVTKEIYVAYQTRSEMFNTVFGDKRGDIFISKLEIEVKNMIFIKHPEMKGNIKANVLLTMFIQGFHHAYFENSIGNYDEIPDLLARVSVMIAQFILES